MNVEGEEDAYHEGLNFSLVGFDGVIVLSDSLLDAFKDEST
jgi:hypothetical protein